MSEDFDALSKAAREGMERLIARGTLALPRAAYEERLDRELSVIAEMDQKKRRAPGSGTWPGFLLFTADYANAARARGVYVGPGRGSAAASLVCLCIGITTGIDPIRYRLIFERFLNTARVSSPDIDLDFSDQGVVIDYLEEKYGKNRVVRISAPQYMKPKSALQEVGRVLNISFSDGIRLGKAFDAVDEQHKLFREFKDVDPRYLDKALELSDELQDYALRYPRLFPLARRFVGVLRNHTTHPAGVLVMLGPAGAEIPLMRVGGKTQGIRTAWDCKALEALGYVKADVLSVTNFQIIAEAISMVRARHGVTVVPDEIPHDDAKARSIFRQGLMVGTFQLGDNAVANRMARETVDTMEDVALINAAIRPGIEWEKIIAHKQDPHDVYYSIPGLRGILEDSYGVFTYQEQIMFAVRDLAGFSMEEADQVRRVVATTSNAALQYDIETYRDRFLQGCHEKGHSLAAAQSVWGQIKALANYCFNKAHALAYGMTAWHEAYLKARWPAEYLCACINDETRKTDRDEYEKFVEDARNFDVKVKAPNVNRSKGFSYVDADGAIVLGLRMLKHVGGVADQIHKHAPYSSFGDFCTRSGAVSEDVKMSAGGELFTGGQIVMPGSVDQVTESLIHGGAFDSVHPRAEILKALMPDTNVTTALTATLEREALGLFVTANPLADVAEFMRGWIESDRDKRRGGPLGGLVLSVRTSAKGHGFLTIRTLTATLDVVCWADEWAQYEPHVKVGMIVGGKAWKTKRGNYSISDLGEITPDVPAPVV